MKMAEDRSVVAEVKQLVGQTTRLLKLEVELGKAELAGKAGSLAKGAGLLVAAALLGLVSLLVLTAAAVLVLATAVAGWLAALIVFGVYLAAALLIALIGLSALKKATPLVPKRAIDSLKGDIEWVGTQLKSARR